jgi:hypothetical protein
MCAGLDLNAQVALEKEDRDAALLQRVSKFCEVLASFRTLRYVP